MGNETAKLRFFFFFFFLGGGGGLCLCGNDAGFVHFLHIVAKTPLVFPK